MVSLSPLNWRHPIQLQKYLLCSGKFPGGEASQSVVFQWDSLRSSDDIKAVFLELKLVTSEQGASTNVPCNQKTEVKKNTLNASRAKLDSCPLTIKTNKMLGQVRPAMPHYSAPVSPSVSMVTMREILENRCTVKHSLSPTSYILLHTKHQIKIQIR